MLTMDLNEIGMLILRLAVAYIYLHGVFMIGSTKNRRVIALSRTSILFRSIESNRHFHLLSKFAFYSALFLMSSGSLLILTGLSIKLGALMLIIFTIPAIIVHKRESVKSHTLSETIKKYSNSETHNDIEMLAEKYGHTPGHIYKMARNNKKGWSYA